MWISSSKVAGFEALPAVCGFRIDERQTERPWIAVSSLSAELGIAAVAVKEAVKAVQRSVSPPGQRRRFHARWRPGTSLDLSWKTCLKASWKLA